jgi:hypothetical protein
MTASERDVSDKPHGAGHCGDCGHFDRPPMGLIPPGSTNPEKAGLFADAGFCRRNSPWPSPGSPEFTYWPRVLRANTCGAFIRRDDVAGQTRCGGCRYYQRPPMGLSPPPNASEAGRVRYLKAGFCTRHAPAPGPRQRESTTWPMVDATDWCADGEPGLPVAFRGIPRPPNVQE